jgi:hypothetical protein
MYGRSLLRLRAYAALGVAWLSLIAAQPASGQQTRGAAAATSALLPGVTPKADLSTEVAALREEMSALRQRFDELEPETPPLWAQMLDQRIERVARLTERVAARVETPIPRLDEPLTLLTVAACMLFLGILLGRRSRRGDRRDPRLRL